MVLDFNTMLHVNQFFCAKSNFLGTLHKIQTKTERLMRVETIFFLKEWLT